MFNFIQIYMQNFTKSDNGGGNTGVLRYHSPSNGPILKKYEFYIVGLIKIDTKYVKLL